MCQDLSDVSHQAQQGDLEEQQLLVTMVAKQCHHLVASYVAVKDLLMSYPKTKQFEVLELKGIVLFKMFSAFI